MGLRRSLAGGKWLPKPTGCYYLLDRGTTPKSLKLKTKVQVLQGALTDGPIGYVLSWCSVNK